MPSPIPGYPVAVNYLLTIFAVIAFFLSLTALTIRLRSRALRRSPTLLVVDLVILLCGLILCIGVIFLMLSDDEPSTRSALCRAGGQMLPAALQTYTWTAAIRAFLKVRHLRCPPPSQSVYRFSGGDRCSRVLTLSAIATIAATAAVLGLLPTLIASSGTVAKSKSALAKSGGHEVPVLKCLPIFPWDSNLRYYSIILFLFAGLGLLYFAILLCLLLCAHCGRNCRRDGATTANNANAGKHSATAQSVADFLTLCATNGVFIALAGLSDKQQVVSRVLRWLFLWCAIIVPFVHAVLTLTIQWRRFKRHKKMKALRAWSSIPRSFMHVQRVMEGQYKWIFRVDWITQSGTLQKGDLKIFAPSEKRQWTCEVYAARKLTRYPHPGLCRYLWLSKTNPHRAVFASLINEGTLEKGCRLICRLNYDGGELCRFLSMNAVGFLHLQSTALEITSALRHLKHLRILHNALSTSSVQVTLTNGGHSFKPVIVDFEESLEIPIELLIQRNAPPRLVTDPERDCDPRLAAIQRPEKNEDDVFSSDTRAFGLFLLDILLTSARRTSRTNSRLDEENSVKMADARSTTTTGEATSSTGAVSPEKQQLIHPLCVSPSSSAKAISESLTMIPTEGSICSRSELQSLDCVSRQTLSTAMTTSHSREEPRDCDVLSTLPARRFALSFTPTLHQRRYCDSLQRRFYQWLPAGSLVEGDIGRLHRCIVERLKRSDVLNCKEAEEMALIGISAWTRSPCVGVEEIDQALSRTRLILNNTVT